MKKSFFSREMLFSDVGIIVMIALGKLILNMCFHGGYGYFRDELYYIACSEHLALGFVDHPSLSILLLTVTRLFLGSSLHAIRFLPAVAGAGVVVLTGLMVRKLGGNRFAQVLGALAAAFSPVVLANGARYFSMNAFDLFFWAWAAYIVIVIIREERPKLWLRFGLVAGLGLMNKYSMGFFVAGLVFSLLLTKHRKQLISRYFWLGALIASVIVLPHVLWQVTHGFPSLEFMANASGQKVVRMVPHTFLIEQVHMTGLIQALLWIAGLGYGFFHQEGRKFRLFGWLFLALLIFMLTRSVKPYYLTPVYAPLIAAGCVFAGLMLKRIWMRAVLVALLVLFSMVAMPLAIPVLPVENYIAYIKNMGIAPRAEEHHAMGALPQPYADMFGWEAMVEQVAEIYNGLTPEEQAGCVIYMRNYGQAAAIDFFGKKVGLPKAVCAHNSYWYWGTGNPDATVAIIMGHSHDVQENLDDLLSEGRFDEAVHAATTRCKYCMPYENHRPIFLCRGPHFRFKDIWEREKAFI